MEETNRTIRLSSALTTELEHPYGSFDPKDTLKIFVGPESREAHINKDILRRKSKFFRDILVDELAHSEPRIVHLPDTDSETFAAFHHWILQQEFLCNIREKQQWCLSLTKIWVFARKMGAPDLANKTMEYMRTTISNNKDATCPSAEAAKYLWEQPDPCSNLRELFTQSFPLTWKEGIDTIGYPSDFVTTALLRYLRETKTVPQVRVKRSDLLKRKSFRHFHEAVPNPETSRITRSSQRIASSQQRSRGTSRGSRARRSLASSQKQRNAIMVSSSK